MIRVLLVICALLTGCSKEPQFVPTAVQLKPPPPPHECSVVGPDDLAPLPKLTGQHTVESVARSFAIHHRHVRKQYRALRARALICSTYTRRISKLAR